MREIIVGKVYRHFKNKWYKVKDIAEDTTTGKLVVVYQALYGEGKTYIRELFEFGSLTPVSMERGINVTGQLYRFMSKKELIENNLTPINE